MFEACSHGGMRRVHRSFVWVPILWTLVSLDAAMDASRPVSLKGPGDGGRVISNLRIEASGQDYGIRLESVKDVVIDQVFITGSKQSGIFLKDCEGIRIRRCTLASTGLRGVQLSSAGGNRNVAIEDCEIYGATDDGIYTGEKSGAVQQFDVFIRRNWIHHVSSNLSWPGHYHGMYIQSAEAVIEDNLITDVVDGNGISMRSSGVARGNRILRVGKAGLAYFNDHPSGPSLKLVWENNLIWEVANNLANIGGDTAPIRVLDLPPKPAPPKVEIFSGKGNRIQKGKLPLLSTQWPASAYAGLEIRADLTEPPSEADPRRP